MDKERLLNIVNRPAGMDYENDPLLLMESIETYPYFQPAYALLARAYTARENVYADKYTRLSAAYTGDREVLYHLIHPAPVIENIIAEPANIQAESIAVINEAAVTENTVKQENKTYNTDNIELPEIHEEKTTPIYQLSESLIESPVAATEILDLEHPAIETSIGEVMTPPAEDNEPISLAAPIQDEVHQEEYTHTPVVANEEPQEITSTTEPEQFITKEKEEVPVKEEKTELKNFLDNLGLSTLASYDYFAYYQKMQELAAKKEAAENSINEPLPDKSSEKEMPSEEASIKNTLKIDPEESFNKELTFAEWLKNLEKKEDKTEALSQDLQAEKPKTEKISKVKKTERIDHNSLINNFIKSDPGIKRTPAKIFTPEDMAHKSAEEDFNLATETLADIYVKQGLFSKAIEIFQQLILRYPQKSPYFAARIEEVKNKKN